MRMFRNVLFMLLVVVATPIFGQTSHQGKLAETVDAFLEKSQTVDDIETLLSILGNDSSKFQSKFDYIPSINPLNPKNQKRVSSKFGMRFHPIDKKNKPHLGIDISAKAGTPIHAAASGIIKSTKESNTGYGNQVFIEHNYGFSTRYAHMYLFIVEDGQTIKKGQIIGFVGNTGKSTADHIHFEIRKHGTAIDPYPFIFLEL